MSTKMSVVHSISGCMILFHALMFWGCPPVQARAVDIKMPDELPVSTADITVSYTDERSRTIVNEVQIGRYSMASPLTAQYGKLVHVLTDDGGHHGCLPLTNAPNSTEGKWIALVERGHCKFHQKVINAAFFHKASAVVVYNNAEEELLLMHHFIDDVVSVFVHKHSGEHLARLLDDDIAVYMNISLQKVEIYDTTAGSAKKTYKVQPLLIISVTMITCLIVGLTALLICGIRRAKSQRKKSNRRHIVFTVNDVAAHQRLLVTDLHDYMLEPNNNNPNHSIVNPNHSIVNPNHSIINPNSNIMNAQACPHRQP